MSIISDKSPRTTAPGGMRMPEGSRPIISYPWYLGDWWGSETRLKLSLAERGLYRELLDHCHAEGSIPDDVVLIARMCAVSVRDARRTLPAIRHLFVEEGNRLVSPKAAEVREKLVGYHQKQKTSGTAGARKRWATKNSESTGESTGDFHVISKCVPSDAPHYEHSSESCDEVSPTESTNAYNDPISNAIRVVIATPIASSTPASTSTSKKENLCPIDIGRDGDSRSAAKPKKAVEPWSRDAAFMGFLNVEFWPEYPRKEKKKSAVKVLWRLHQQHGLNFLRETILPAVQNQKRAGGRLAPLNGCGFAPYAITWLNGEEWENQDEMNSPEAAPALIEL